MLVLGVNASAASH